MASIFLSHSSQDNEIAHNLSLRLRESGYESLFLDFDPDSGIKAGRDWERELYRNLKLAGAVIVLCSPDSMTSRWCFVEIAQAKALGKAIFPIKISPCRVEALLNDRQVIDVTALGLDAACRRLIDGLRAAGLDPEDSFHWDPKRPPFPGLNSFDAPDAGIYFGREDEVRLVIETLTRLRRQGEPRLLVLVGSSGSGKSSLVRAGVLPRLGKDRSQWTVVGPFRPGAEPIGELARALYSAFPDGSGREDWKAIRDRLRDEARAATPGESTAPPATSVLTEYADDLTIHLEHREASVLIVVDQTEELLQSLSGDEAAAFFSVLRRATERPRGRVFGLLTLRSDFLGSFQNHPALRGLAFTDVPLGLMPVEHFSQVIEGPADRAEIALEPGLVRSMIADARTDDALPLLAFTLREMYERCRHLGRLTLKVYRDDLGGMKGAVARVVERIKREGNWTPDVNRALRRAFLKLVRVNDEGRFTRQPCRWADLPDLAAPVLEAFVKARLLSSNGDVVEVTHESLFRVWPELAGWLDEGRELMVWKKAIKEEVKDWLAHDRSPLYLLGGARVSEGRRWLATNELDFPGEEGEFIAASIAAEDARVARERAQQEKLRWLARILAVAAVTASILGVYALVQRDEANARTKAALKAEAKEKSQRLLADAATQQARALAKVATSRQLAVLSTAEREKRFDRSLLLAATALQTENTIEARDSLYNALQGRPWLTSFLHSTEGSVQKAVFSPDGKIVAAAYDSEGAGGVVLWDVTGRKRLGAAPLAVTEGGVSSVAFSPDGKILAAGYYGDSGGVVLWDVAAGDRLGSAPLPVSEGGVHSVAFSPDGKTLAAGYRAKEAGGVVLWDVARRERLGISPLPVTESNVRSVAFSPDGKTIAAGCGEYLRDERGGVVLWDATAGKRLGDGPLPVTEGGVYSVAFNPDGKTIAAGYRKASSVGGVVVWELATRERLGNAPAAVTEGGVSSVTFSPDGKTIAAGYDRVGLGAYGVGGVLLLDAAGGKRLGDAPLSVPEGGVHSVAFSPDGKTIAAGFSRFFSDDGASGVLLLDVTARSRLVDELLPLAKKLRVYHVAYSPDGKILAAAYYRSGIGVALWDVAERKPLGDMPLPLKDAGVRSLAFSPDGKTIAAGYDKSEAGEKDVGGVFLLDLVGRKTLDDAPLSVSEGGVHSVAFSPDGTILAAGFDSHSLAIKGAGGAVLWDVAGRKRLGDAPLPVAEGGVHSVAFSPDGTILAAGYHRMLDTDVGSGVVLWDVAGRKRLDNAPLPVGEGGVTSVAFSSDGKLLAAGCQGFLGNVVLWDVAGRKRLDNAPFPVTEGGVTSAAFSPDGKTIAAAFNGLSGIVSVGGVVRWEVATGLRVLHEPLTAASGTTLTKLAFSPDGKTLAAGSHGQALEGGVLLWDVDVESWLQRAAQIANRNFTRKEWLDYFHDLPYQPTFPDLPVPPPLSPNAPASATDANQTPR